MIFNAAYFLNGEETISKRQFYEKFESETPVSGRSTYQSAIERHSDILIKTLPLSLICIAAAIAVCVLNQHDIAMCKIFGGIFGTAGAISIIVSFVSLTILMRHSLGSLDKDDLEELIQTLRKELEENLRLYEENTPDNHANIQRMKGYLNRFPVPSSSAQLCDSHNIF